MNDFARIASIADTAVAIFSAAMNLKAQGQRQLDRGDQLSEELSAFVETAERECSEALAALATLTTQMVGEVGRDIDDFPTAQ